MMTWRQLSQECERLKAENAKLSQQVDNLNGYAVEVVYLRIRVSHLEGDIRGWRRCDERWEDKRWCMKEVELALQACLDAEVAWLEHDCHWDVCNIATHDANCSPGKLLMGDLINAYKKLGIAKAREHSPFYNRGDEDEIRDIADLQFRPCSPGGGGSDAGGAEHH